MEVTVTINGADHAHDVEPRMTVFVEQAKYRATHDGTDYWFCAPGCLRAFEADPAAYTQEPPRVHNGVTA